MMPFTVKNEHITGCKVVMPMFYLFFRRMNKENVARLTAAKVSIEELSGARSRTNGGYFD
jgi:hypothetical protein